MVNDKMVNVMKNEVNRAFMARKKQYNQPVVSSESIRLESTILVGSVAGDVVTFHPAISTNDQW